jgi:hypothetical protein
MDFTQWHDSLQILKIEAADKCVPELKKEFCERSARYSNLSYFIGAGLVSRP